jgi:hypothetical protein
MRLLPSVAISVAIAVSCPAHGQVQSPSPSERLEFRDDVPIEVYLSLLAQVAPPARDGAEAYMAAFKSRCGRPLKTVELRRAFAEGDGDATLLAMVRASHQRDAAELQRLAAKISCSPRS